MIIRRTLLTALSMLLAGVMNLAAQRPEVAADRYFVSFRQPIAATDTAFLRAQGVQLDRTFPEVRAVEIVVRSAAQLAAIQRSPRVEFVEPIPMRYATDLSTEQLVPSLDNGLYGLITSKAVDVHNLGHTGAGVKIGVADTAIDCSHVDIAANLVESVDTVRDEQHGGCWQVSDGAAETHATHVAGIALGVFNGAGIYGVAPNASLYHARVLGARGGTAVSIMEGVRYLVDAGVQVVNLSLGGTRSSRVEERFYIRMRNRGVLVVAATGNDGSDPISFPAGYASNVAVGAVDKNNALADFSNFGTNIDLVAPGVGVLSSVPAGQGRESSVTTTSTFPALGIEFAGGTASTGLTGNLVTCGLALTAADCAAGIFGNIALIQRGEIPFAEKVANAMTAGAIAAIIYNNEPGDLLATLGEPTNNGQPWIPAVGVSDTTGAALSAQLGSPATVRNVPIDWDTFNGTSMAAPHVAGVIALMWGAAPSLSNDEIESNLFSTATDLGAAGYDTIFGHGMIDALAAVQASVSVPAAVRARR